MRVTIKDVNVLRNITPDELRDYVLKIGFERMGGDTEMYSAYSEKFHRHFNIAIPEVVDEMYPLIMAENLMYLEQYLDESQLYIYCNIKRQNIVFYHDGADVSEI